MILKIILMMLMTVGVVEATERFNPKGMCNQNGETDWQKCVQLNKSAQPRDIVVALPNMYIDFFLGFMACLILIAGIGTIWSVVATYKMLKKE